MSFEERLADAVTTAGTTSPCARICTSHSIGPAGTSAIHTGRSACTVDTARSSRGPTVTVFVTGVIDRT